MTYSVQRKTIDERPVLFMRRRVKQSAVAMALRDMLPAVFHHCQREGIAVAGAPFCRYVEWSPGLVTIEGGIVVAAPAAGAESIEAGTLHGGSVAMTVHLGSYDRLPDAHAAVQAWIEAQGAKVLAPNGAPWESYVNDPADHPQGDWKTEVYWPLEG